MTWQSAVKDYLPWLMSAITIWMTLLAGNKHRFAWAVGLANQMLWLLWILVTASWGLLPMNIGLWLLYLRNHWKWQAVEGIRGFSTETQTSAPERPAVSNHG